MTSRDGIKSRTPRAFAIFVMAVTSRQPLVRQPVVHAGDARRCPYVSC
jgi:hypothetical protein